MEGDKSAGLSPVSDDDGPSEDDEESAFHREIILQDNYSEEDDDDSDGDRPLGAYRAYRRASPPNHRGYYGQRGGNGTLYMGGRVQDRGRYVRFAQHPTHIPAMPFKHMGYGLPTGNGVYTGYNVLDASAPPSKETPNISLLSLLPSRIVGSAVEMSKYLSEYVAAHPDLEERLRNIPELDKRKEFGEQIFPESALTGRLRAIDTTQAAIEGAAALAARHPYPPGALMQLMHDIFVSIPTNAAATRLGIFYVYNHLVHKFVKASWDNKTSFVETGLNRFCIPAIMHINRIHCTTAVHIITCINVWRQRRIYDAETCDHLEELLNNSDDKRSTIELQTDTTTYTVNSEVGAVKTLRYLFKMPLVDCSYEEAVEGVDEAAIADSAAPLHDKSVAEAASKDKYAAFDHVSRLSGQELILLHSSSLDLAALIEEGDKHLYMLDREIAELLSHVKQM
ncbi:uncharacterized protein BXIN_0775 [Babesia sp. Xinjiang]|uniref:uncharacterized protein n=1 Tax=Babesia sp. Xinjiang TaxID=462227 RepID=UPI000A258FAB|nr:uncharacterized protein BXIN_0775 [Babesia sp. Xinjiang]ORM41334.1 hypothetical protein BXIN_0775 [Babesia sp. Xinjiang]